MKTLTCKDRAHALSHEWIPCRDGTGDICLRPMLFNDEGIRQVTMHPSPCEFEPFHKALARLENLESEAQ